MKKEDIKSAKPLGLTEGMVVCEVAKLRKTGTGVGIKFHVGDKIQFPPIEDLEVYSTSFTGRDGKEREYELVKVAFNEKVRLIPVASFRRDRNGVDEVADEYSRQSELCRDLQMANDDFERISMLAGHTVIVKNIFGTGRNYKYVEGTRVPYNKDDVNTFTTAAWPIFEFVD